MVEVIDLNNKKDDNGNLLGIWGAMSDLSRSFHPWEDNFSKGLYLAGVECDDNAEAPSGWTKWIIPGYEYIYVEVENETTFPNVLNYMHLNHLFSYLILLLRGKYQWPHQKNPRLESYDP